MIDTKSVFVASVQSQYIAKKPGTKTVPHPFQTLWFAIVVLQDANYPFCIPLKLVLYSRYFLQGNLFPAILWLDAVAAHGWILLEGNGGLCFSVRKKFWCETIRFRVIVQICHSNAAFAWYTDQQFTFEWKH